MACREHEAQQVVADVVVDLGFECGRELGLIRFDLVAKLFVLALDELAAAYAVDRPVLRGGREPRARIVGHAAIRPLLERSDERILCELLGESDIAHDAREARDHARGFDAPDRVDGAMGVGCCHGRR